MATPRPSKWKNIKRRVFPRGIRFTKQGKIYIAVTLGVGFAAVNTGNNLLFLVLGLMLGLIVVSGILSEVTLRGLVIERHLDSRVEAGLCFPVELAVSNRKRYAASFGVELRDEIGGVPFRRRCFFLRVGAGERRAIAYRCEIHRRGRARFDGTIVSTRFPFGLFEKSRFIPLKDEIIALPRRIKIEVPLPSTSLGEGETSRAIQGAGQEFRELREMVYGDDPRRIDWRSTARLGRPMVRENDADAAGFLEVVLDPARPPDAKDPDEQVERNISAAATIVHALARQGVAVQLCTSPPQVLVSRGDADTLRLLTHLALLDASQAERSAPPRGESPGAVLIGPRASGEGASVRLPVPPSIPHLEGGA
jgi:uncharacterized protein (DUF58 family)